MERAGTGTLEHDDMFDHHSDIEDPSAAKQPTFQNQLAGKMDTEMHQEMLI